MTLWTIACQAPLSMGLSEQGYWSGLPCGPPGDLPDPGMEPALASRFFTTSATWKALNIRMPVYKVSKLPRFYMKTGSTLFLYNPASLDTLILPRSQKKFIYKNKRLT